MSVHDFFHGDAVDLEGLARYLDGLDDLVTDAACRSKGNGKVLLTWLVRQARDEGCRYLELDSGVQRFDAHRFYLANRMIISARHFTLKL